MNSCPYCAQTNLEQAEVCLHCGCSLVERCERCGTALLSGAKFCHACGRQATLDSAAISPAQGRAPTGLTDERKQVTVLVADIKSSTESIASVDPEEAKDILDPIIERMKAAVRRHGGTVNRVTGDGIMALFGAPAAQEDHALRACHSALAMHEALSSFAKDSSTERSVITRIRVGINTGQALVRGVEHDFSTEYAAVGVTTHLAARMEQLAAPGQTLMTANVLRLVEPFVATRSLGWKDIKGLDQPIEVFELVDAGRPRRGAEAAPSRLLTKFVGRDRELSTLIGAWERAKSGRGQVISVVGEAGVGKSRLLVEFKARLNDEGASCWEGSCYSYGDNISYLPFVEVLKSIFDLASGGDESWAKARVVDRVVQLGLNREEVGPYLHHVLAYEVDVEDFAKLTPFAIRERTAQAIRSLLFAHARGGPYVLIIEDLHWIDKATEEVLGTLVDVLADTPILLLLVYRPEYLHAWATKPYHQQIVVDPLSEPSSADLLRAILAKPFAAKLPVVPLAPDDSRAMAQSLLGARQLRSDLAQFIADRAGGNPLFVEELTSSLAESGHLVSTEEGLGLSGALNASAIPATLQGVLLARVDRIGERLKRVLQIASAIGRVFSYPVLARVTRGIQPTGLEQALAELDALELIYPLGGFPQGQYSFKHVLVQQAVYQTLTKPKREQLHEDIASAMESLYPDRAEEYCELLAYHYGASRNAEKAFVYSEQSNRKAIRSHAMIEAKDYFYQAMRALDRLADTPENRSRRIALLANQAPVMTLLFAFAEIYELLKQYKPLAEGLNNPGLLSGFLACLGHCQWFFAELDEALDTLTTATRLADESRNYAAAGYAYMLLEWTHLYQGDLTRALLASTAALDRTQKQFNLRTYTWAVAAAALANAFRGNWSTAIEQCVIQMRTSEALSDNSTVCFSAMMQCVAHTIAGDRDESIRCGEFALEKCVTPADKIWATGFYGFALCRAGETHRAIDLLETVVAGQAQAGFLGGEHFRLWLGEAYLSAREFERARDVLNEGCRLWHERGMRLFFASGQRLLGEVAIQEAAHPVAIKYFESSIEMLRAIGAAPELALACSTAGQSLADQGYPEQARGYYREAIAIAERLGLNEYRSKLDAQIARL